jgi:hypothetical protein
MLATDRYDSNFGNVGLALGHPFKVRLLIEAGRFVVYYLVTILEAAQDPAPAASIFMTGA